MAYGLLPVFLLVGGLLHLIQGIRTILNPTTFLSTFGLPHSASAIDLAPAYGGRNVALSLTMVVFYWHEMYRPAGLMLLCCTVGALVDTYVAGLALRGKQVKSAGMMYSHLGGFVVLAFLGWGLMAAE